MLLPRRKRQQAVNDTHTQTQTLLNAFINRPGILSFFLFFFYICKSLAKVRNKHTQKKNKARQQRVVEVVWSVQGEKSSWMSKSNTRIWTERKEVVWLLARDPASERASMTLCWTGEAAYGSRLEGKTRRHFEKEFKWVILPQVQILTEHRHDVKHIWALASTQIVSLAHSSRYLTHGNPLINSPPPTTPRLFFRAMKEALHRPSRCKHISGSPGWLQQVS